VKVRSESQLRDYQRYLVRVGMRKRFVLFAVDMGLGKTAAVLTILRNLRNQVDTRKVLIVAPKRVAEETWPEEIAAWRHTQRIPYSVIVGTPAQRNRALRDKRAFIHIINKENLQWLWQTLRNGADWDYDMIVIDEASMLKEGKKRTTRAGGGEGSRPLSRFGILARARHKVDRVIEMTGTPAPEGLHNLWGLSYILDLGERLGASKSAFEARWFDKGYMGYDTDPFPHSEREIMAAIKDVMISLRAEDHLDLPPVITTPDTDIWVNMCKEDLREYRAFEREMFTDKYDVEAVSNGVLVNKLLQFANGSLYRKKGEDIPVHDLKAHALLELVESLQGRPLLLATNYKFDRDRVKKFLGKKVTFIEDAGKNWKKDWDKGRIKVLASHPSSLSHGLNMQFGGARACWYGLQHSGELYQQFNTRLPRPGQVEEHVFIYHILTRGTWDEKVIRNQEYKKGSETSIRKACAVYREDILRELQAA